MFFCFFVIPLEKIFQKAKDEAARLNKVTTSRDGQTTKDDIARLLNLFKEPGAQRHWSAIECKTKWTPKNTPTLGKNTK